MLGVTEHAAAVGQSLAGLDGDVPPSDSLEVRRFLGIVPDDGRVRLLDG
jgi:hypothetical protein